MSVMKMTEPPEGCRFETLARYSKLELEMMTVPQLREAVGGFIRRSNLLSKEKLIGAIWKLCEVERVRLGIVPPEIPPEVIVMPEIVMSQAELCPRTLQENLVLGVASSIERLYATAAKTGSYKVESEANRAALGLLTILKTYEKNLEETEEDLSLADLSRAVAGQSNKEILEGYLNRLKGG